jgi:hypothetical protein
MYYIHFLFSKISGPKSVLGLFMIRIWPVQRLKCGNPTTGLSSSRPVTRPRKLSITFLPQYKDERKANMTK